MNKEMKITLNGVSHWVKASINHQQTYPIIVIHGGPGGFNYVFERVPGALLEKDLNIIYYEQRGCGRSDQPIDGNYTVTVLIGDLHELIKTLAFDKVILLGYSFGAELAAEYAVKYPDKVFKLILQAPSYFADMDLMFKIQHDNFLKNGLKFKQWQSQNIVERYDEMWQQIELKEVDRFLFYKASNAHEMRRLWSESGLINTGLMSKQVFNRSRRQSLFHDLKEIQIPTLVIVGRHDQNVGLLVAETYHQNIKNSQLIVFEESGHFPDYEESKRYHQVIKDFVKEKTVNV